MFVTYFVDFASNVYNAWAFLAGGGYKRERNKVKGGGGGMEGERRERGGRDGEREEGGMEGERREGWRERGGRMGG